MKIIRILDAAFQSNWTSDFEVWSKYGTVRHIQSFKLDNDTKIEFDMPYTEVRIPILKSSALLSKFYRMFKSASFESGFNTGRALVAIFGFLMR